LFYDGILARQDIKNSVWVCEIETQRRGVKKIRVTGLELRTSDHILENAPATEKHLRFGT